MGRGVLEKSFALLGAVMSHPGDIGLTELAHICGIPKATAHRLLHQLEAIDVIYRSNGGYRMGSYAFRLGQAWEPYPRLLTAARRPLHELAATTRTSAVLTVRCHGDVMIAAVSLASVEDLLLLRPGSAVPDGMDLVATPVLAPTGERVGTMAAAVPEGRRPDAFNEAVRHAARAVSAALTK